MYSRTIAIYSFVDDLLKASNHCEDRRQKVSDAQVMTTALLAMMDYGGNFERANVRLAEAKLFSCPRLSRARFSRRLNRLSDLLHLLFHQLGAVLKELNIESRYLLDSFPVPICDNLRIRRSRLTKGVSKKEDYRGFMAAKKRYFFGVRVQVVTTAEGLPVEFSILPGDSHDLQGFSELALDFTAEDQIFADSADTFYEWEDYLKEQEQIKLLVTRKKTSERGDVPAMKDYKQIYRHYIETVFGEIEKMFPKKIHATNLNGFLLKISLFLLAYQIDKGFIQ